METPRELFLKYDYVEAKDLCKQFLTLNTAVVVFSLTFSDKVLGFTDASDYSRILLVASWCCLLASIAACGISLAYISAAFGQVVYHERSDYQHISERTMIGIVLAGALFVAGLIALAVAAAQAVIVR